MAIFKKKTEIALAKIKTKDEFCESDKMVNYVFKIGENLFNKPLDVVGESELIKVGGKLTGVYAYLGNKASYARAERDVYEQKRDEVLAELSLDAYPETEKITVAKAKAKLEVSELNDFVIQREAEKNNYENLLYATDRMISFIQSAVKVKEAERFRSNRDYDNG